MSHPDNRGCNRKNIKRWVWNRAHKAKPAEVFFARQELVRWNVLKTPFIVIEPNIKPRASPCKQWPFEYYQQIVTRLRGQVPFLQLVPKHGQQRVLKGVTTVQTNLRETAGYLSKALLFLGPEGGMHHIAAAVRCPAIVIFGAYIPPSITGYNFHHNFHVGDTTVEGWRSQSHLSDKIMSTIDPFPIMRMIEQALK